MSTTDIIGYTSFMGRWEPNARGRLQEAALALYGERGYEQTTVADIAKRAGLTERTFFRYFADKREVLFWGAAALQERLLSALEEAPDSLPPIERVGRAFEAVTDLLQDSEYSRARQRIIAANPELREREQIKLASLAVAAAEALQKRGVKDSAANLAAEMGVAVFRVAFERWLVEAKKRTLSAVFRESFEELKAVSAGK